MKFTDKRGREWEMFVDRCYYDCVCVRIAKDIDFNSNTSFHFNTQQQADQFVELLKIAD
jgi:hypothetical protein